MSSLGGLPREVYDDIEFRVNAYPVKKTLGHVLLVSGSGEEALKSSVVSYTGLVVKVEIGLREFEHLGELKSGDYLRRQLRARWEDASCYSSISSSCDVEREAKELVEAYLKRSLSVRFLGE